MDGLRASFRYGIYNDMRFPASNIPPEYGLHTILYIPGFLQGVFSDILIGIISACGTTSLHPVFHEDEIPLMDGDIGNSTHINTPGCEYGIVHIGKTFE